MAYISGKYTSATSYTVTLGGMKIGTVYAILVQDLNTDGSSNGFICKWKSGATSSTHTVTYTTTAAYSQYDRRIGFFQGSFETSVGTVVSDANFEKWADGEGVISAWNGGGSTTYTIGVDANGGTYGGPMPTVSSSYPYLSLTAISNSTSRSGYKLTGWLWSVDGIVYSTTATISGISSSGTLTAQWERTSFTITLYGNGGLWGGNLQKRTLTKNVGETVSFAEYGPNGTPPLQYAYHTLAGWGTSATGTAAWDPNGYVTVGATDANYYAIWKKHIDPFYWDGGSGSSDGSIIAAGLPLSNLTAARWNRLMATLAELAEGNGSSFIYSPVVAGSRITAAGFNAVRSAIAAQPGHGATPGTRSTGDSILASYYNGAGSLKTALNGAIIYYNNR